MLSLHRMTFMTVSRRLVPSPFCVHTASHDRAEREILAGCLADHFVGSIRADARISRAVRLFRNDDGVASFRSTPG
jgi:hypothetical protein